MRDQRIGSGRRYGPAAALLGLALALPGCGHEEVVAPAGSSGTRSAAAVEAPGGSGGASGGAAATGLPIYEPESVAQLGRAVAKRRCVVCHQVEGEGGVLAPPMEINVRERREKLADYETHARRLRATDPARYRASKTAIDAAAAAKDPDERLALWLRAYLKNPTFDNATNEMTPQILEPSEIEQLIAYMLALKKAR